MPDLRHIKLAYNNVYVFDSGGTRVVVDTGPDYAGASAILAAETSDRRPELVVATHGHHDHAGLGRWWQERGVTVAVGDGDAHLASRPPLSTQTDVDGFGEYIRSLGAPDWLREQTLSWMRERQQAAVLAATDIPHRPDSTGRWPTQLRYLPFEPDLTLYDGDAVAGTTLSVLLCPGHTPGNLVLYEPEEGWLFSGDQLLPKITPTPAIQPAPPAEAALRWRFPSLPRFLDSLHRLRELNPSRCFPGHGDPFGNVAEVVEANIHQVEQRTEKVLAALRESGSETVYGVTLRLYPRAVERHFWQMISTVQGHLDLLEERALVARKGHVYIAPA